MKRTYTPGTDLHGYGGEIRKELDRRFPRNDVRVLDVGTGFAGNVQFLARVMSEGSRIWTLDPSMDALTNAKEALKAEGLDHKVEFVHAGIENAELDEGFFDVLVSVMALHHLRDLRTALRKMARVVKPRGKIILVDFEPIAARKLKFGSLHEESGFFTGKAVNAALGRLTRSSKVSSFGLWYVVEGMR